ncbi:MAG: geranylgeranylglycerol-phosphate geranylgeranyltransferase [Paludibacteraceae bacterium]|nr:geranylgeranylglycerol-phosphate geranylgeranyltransferase [Paludibacteraceae bacterium]
MKDVLKLIRWQNLLFLGILLWVMHYWVALPIMRSEGMSVSMPWWMLLLVGIGVVCIAAGGYVINDYFDIKIDRINRPDRVIVTNAVSKLTAMRMFQVLTLVGLAFGLTASYLCRSTSMMLIFMLTPGLLWFYSASYKRMFLVGNIIIAFVAGLVPLLVALTNVSWLTHCLGDIVMRLPLPRTLYIWLGCFALFAFLTTLTREIIKDMQDQKGDRELECHTLPVVIGDTWTKIIVTLLIVATMALMAYLWWSVLPFDRSWHCLSTRYIVFGLIVPFLCELALLWSAKIPSDYGSAQTLMKFIMLLGVLYGLVISRLI